MSIGLREDYFSRIDTATKAYIVGLIAADGNVISDPRRNRLSLELSEKNRELLELVRREVCPRATIRARERASGRFVVLSVSSRRIRHDLAVLGIGPRKSLVLDWPAALAPDLEWAFLLGYFDGDGWVTSWVVGTTIYWRVGLLGTRAFLCGARDAILRHTGVTCSMPQPRENIWRLTKSGKAALKVDAWLHQDPNLGLVRKRPSLSVPPTASGSADSARSP